MEALNLQTESHTAKGLQEISRGGAEAQSIVPVCVHPQKNEDDHQLDVLFKSLLINRLNPLPAVLSSASMRLCGMRFA